jgi:hypothetical protein
MLVGVVRELWKRRAYAGCYAEYNVPVVVEGGLKVSEISLDLVAGLLVSLAVESADLGDKGVHDGRVDLCVLRCARAVPEWSSCLEC